MPVTLGPAGPQELERKSRGSSRSGAAAHDPVLSLDCTGIAAQGLIKASQRYPQSPVWHVFLRV